MSSNRSANRLQTSKNFSKAAYKISLLQKRRDSDAKCRANLSFCFEQLKKQVLDAAIINTRVSREMVLQETLCKIQYLEGILVLLEQTKDKQEGKLCMKSAVGRLDAIHREFTKSYNSSSSHGNRKSKEQFLSDALIAYENKKSKLIPKQRSGMMISPKMAKSTPGHGSDQVVPKPSSKMSAQTRVVKDSPPHTIFVPYIGCKKKDYGPQEVPVCYSPGVRQNTPQKLSMLSASSSYHETHYETQKSKKDSPDGSDGTPSRRYKIKGSSIKCVPLDDDMSWNQKDLDTSDTDSAESSLEPDLTCKEIFPYWLEEDRSERQMRKKSTVTPPKPLNTSQMTYPYPMAPRKTKNTTWSAKYMEHLYQDTSGEQHKNGGFRRQQHRPGKRLFAETKVDVVYHGDEMLSSPKQYIHYVDANYDVKPKRHYRKLCTAARVRPYDPITGKVESPCKRLYKNCRNTKRKASKANEDPEFNVNSYYKRKIKKVDKGLNNYVVTSKRQGKRTTSPQTVYHELIDQILFRFSKASTGNDSKNESGRKREKERSRADNSIKPDIDKEEEESQHSLVLTDVPHLPEDIIGPLDIDDEGIVDTILDLEESSMPPIDLSPEGVAQATKPAYIPFSDNEAFQNTYFRMKQEQNIWNAPGVNDNELQEKEFIDDQSSENDAISSSLAEYACLALSNTGGKSVICKTSPSKQDSRTAPIMSPVLYISPIKQTPLIRNPAWCSTLLSQNDNDQLLNTTKESYSDLSFASPLSTSSLLSSLGHPLVIDVDGIHGIKDVKEVQYTKGNLPAEQKGGTDFWDIDKMMEINSSLDELIDREVFCAVQR
ncbi:uncharacterized protein [Amphiura filiformis]|uniref:uncharacterized protein n=1 Tax=Amphiura filiformis TaxID=82378 RepID=UPI003B21AAE9